MPDIGDFIRPDIGDFIRRSRRSAKIAIAAPDTPGDFRRSQQSAYNIASCVTGFGLFELLPFKFFIFYWVKGDTSKLACRAGDLLGRANVISSRLFIRLATFDLELEEWFNVQSVLFPTLFVFDDECTHSALVALGVSHKNTGLSVVSSRLLISPSPSLFSSKF